MGVQNPKKPEMFSHANETVELGEKRVHIKVPSITTSHHSVSLPIVSAD